MLVISRHMALEPPVPSIASSFRSERIIADARLQRVSSRLNGIAHIARAFFQEGRARLTPSLPDRETNSIRLSSPKDGWWNYLPRSLLRYQQSLRRQRDLKSFSGDDRKRIQRSMGEPWRRAEGRDAKLLEAIQTRTTVRDGGLVGPTARATWAEHNQCLRTCRYPS